MLECCFFKGRAPGGDGGVEGVVTPGGVAWVPHALEVAEGAELDVFEGYAIEVVGEDTVAVVFVVVW